MLTLERKEEDITIDISSELEYKIPTFNYGIVTSSNTVHTYLPSVTFTIPADATLRQSSGSRNPAFQTQESFTLAVEKKNNSSNIYVSGRFFYKYRWVAHTYGCFARQSISYNRYFDKDFANGDSSFLDPFNNAIRGVSGSYYNSYSKYIILISSDSKQPFGFIDWNRGSAEITTAVTRDDYEYEGCRFESLKFGSVSDEDNAVGIYLSQDVDYSAGDTISCLFTIGNYYSSANINYASLFFEEDCFVKDAYENGLYLMTGS